jgi:predicted DNA-binding transcriptional regulator AlpA
MTIEYEVGAPPERHTAPPPSRFVTFAELKRRGIFSNRVTLARAIRRSGFPAPYRLGERRVGWAEHEVEAWLCSRCT